MDISRKAASYITICLYILFEVVYISQCQICMSSRLQISKLQFVCKIYHLHLEVFIIDPNDKQFGHCLLPYSKPSCFSENGEMVQSLLTNQTTLTVGRNSKQSYLNGKWTCLHGSNQQKSSKIVHINEELEENSLFVVNLEGPKYVKKKQAFLLICSSNAVPIDNTALFSITEGHTSRRGHMQIECKTQLNKTSCAKSGIYEMMFNGSQSSGILTFSCEMKFKLAGNLSDCVFVTVVDMTGPALSLNTSLPLFDETLVKLTCTAWSSEGEINFKWECVNATRTDFRQMNDTTHTFVSELTYTVKLLDHGKTCLCEARIGNFTSSESITIKVTKHEGFHIRLFFWTLTAAFILIITVVIFSMQIKRRAQHGELRRVCSVPAIYYAAPQENNVVNIYDGMESHYIEIDDSHV